MIFFNEKGEKINNQLLEAREQELAYRYVENTDRVLELGARYGSVSCAINSKLQNKFKSLQVSVEPDERVWKALEFNKNNNNCHFNIVKGFISNKLLNLTNINECYGGYATTSIRDNNSKIPHFTLNEIKEKYNIKRFNVLIADCEGFLETFLNENSEILDEIRLIIFEADYTEKCNYDKIKKDLINKGFKCLEEGHQNVYQHFDRF